MAAVGDPGATRAPLLAALTSVCVGLALPGAAQTLPGSPDIAIQPGSSVLDSGDVAADLSGSSAAVVDLGPLPDAAEVVAYSPKPGVGQLFVLEQTLELPGGVVAQPFDVVLWDGAAYSLELSGTGVFPPGVGIDAISYIPASGDLWLSLDTTAEVSGTTFRDADVFDGALQLIFDSAAAGVPPGMDVDAVSRLDGTNLLLSFDVGGTLGGVTFADEDVLRYDTVGDSWSLELDLSAGVSPGGGVAPPWEAADLVALPEPGGLLGLASGSAVLLGLRRRRANVRRR